MIALSILPFLWNVFTTFMQRRARRRRSVGGQHARVGHHDRPPPPYNFDSLPPIRSERPLFDLRHKHDRDQLTPPVAAGEAEATS